MQGDAIGGGLGLRRRRQDQAFQPQQHVQRALGLPAVIAMRHRAAQHAQRHDHRRQQVGRAARDGAGDDQPGIDAETAKGEDQRKDIAMGQTARQQCARDHDVKGNRHRQEGAGDGHQQQNKDAELRAKDQFLWQQGASGCAQESGQEHQWHGGLDDEPQIFAIGGGKTDERLKQAFAGGLGLPGGGFGHLDLVGSQLRLFARQHAHDQWHCHQDHEQA